CRERDRRLREAHAFAVGELAANLDPGRDAPGLDLGCDEPDLAVIEKEVMARLDRRQNFRMGQMYPRRVARRRIAIEAKCLALGEQDRAALECADAQLGSLQVDEDSDRPPVFEFDRADRRDELAQSLVRSMAHVDAEDVGTGAEQARDHYAVARCRPARRNALGPVLPA